MSRRLRSFLALALLACAAPAAAQDPAPPAATPPAVTEIAFPEKRWNNDIVRIGNSVVIGPDEAAGSVTTIFGDATIAGRVSHDVVVMVGHASLAPTALIDGELVVVGGSATAEDGARIRGDVTVIGGTFEAPSSVVPGGDLFSLGPQAFGLRFPGLYDWLTTGLLWGRPIAPGVGWVWLAVAVFFLVYLLLALLFETPVREISDAVSLRPFTTFVVGFLVTLLLGPVCLLLAASVVGIAVVPLVLVALFAAWVLGKVGIARWIGRSIVGAAEHPRLDVMRTFGIGFVVISLLYMVPVLGLVAWTLLGVLGVGASALSFMAAYRRESPVFERPRRAAPVAPAAAGAAPAVAFSPVGGAGFVPAMALPGGGDVPFEAVTGDAAPVQEPAPAWHSGLLSFPKASFRDRVLSGLLDLILILLIESMLDPIIGGDHLFALAMAYFVGFWSWKGTTVGGIICQLRIVRVDNQPLRFVDGLVRALSGTFSLVVLGLGVFWILRDADRQAWHDRIAGTYVVKVPKNYPY